jgi:hypothetical protein
LFPASGRTPKEAYHPELLVPTVKHRGGSEVILATISWYSAGPIITLNGRIIASDYVDILGNQVRPTVQMLLPKNTPVFNMNIRPHTQPEVFSLGLSSTELHFTIFPGQHNRQTYTSSNRCGQF